MHHSDDYIHRALSIQISGWITKNRGKEEFLEIIQTIVKGDEYYYQEISQIIVTGFKNRQQANPVDLLSKRGREVIFLKVTFTVDDRQ
jgi:DNA-binding NarL/FixJ family response regulator